MPHIHTEQGQHDTTASGFIVRLDQNEPRLVLHRHKLLGVYLQFGGHVELTETPWQAIAHEIEEESGYTLDQLMVLQPKNNIRALTGIKVHPLPVILMTHAFDHGHNHTDIEYVFTTVAPPRHDVGTDESKDIKCFTRDQLVALPSREIPDNVRELGLFILDTCLKDWEPVETSLFEF